MQNTDLNLARKWRSKNFDEIIGQDLCVRILKNGLYLNSFFPVYLFSGQRGCGKTSTARIFAAAINCEKLANFQNNAKDYSVPCLTCISCESMQKGKHPDFIEIDAASHTGVDNVRNIIEASSLLPLIGRKKIYLIDEAHMLSKAAFNAFLKILEEPPNSVLFILATTDVQKIIDTVRSRCFQLFFSSIPANNLIEHLEYICKKESIQYDLEGLKVIVRESEGSARDAINLLEQVRFSNKNINKEIVLAVLGHLSDEQILHFFDLIINKKSIKEFLSFLEEINFYEFSAEFIWNKLLDLFKISIRLKHGVNVNTIVDYEGKLKEIINKSSLHYIIFVMTEFCNNELVFFKTINKSLFLELLCLKIINSNFDKYNHEITINKIPTSSSIKIKEQEVVVKVEHISKDNDNENKSWDMFIEEIQTKKDSLLESVFLQSKFLNYDEQSGQVSILFSKKSTFFQELINDKTNNWLPILKKVFNHTNCSLNIQFKENETKIAGQADPEKKVYVNDNIKQSMDKNKIFDYSDKEKWKMTNELLKYFPGTISEIREEE